MPKELPCAYRRQGKLDHRTVCEVYLNSDHGMLGGFEHWLGNLLVCARMLVTTVRRAMNAYDPRAVTLGGLPPPGRYASASNEADPRRGVDSPVSSLVTALFLCDDASTAYRNPNASSTRYNWSSICIV